MVAANDFDRLGGGMPGGENTAGLSRFVHAQPRYSAFDEEARIRRRDPGFSERDRLQSLVLVGGFAASALLLFVAGFVSAFLMFDDLAPASVARSEGGAVEQNAVSAPRIENPDPVDFPRRSGLLGAARADAEPVAPLDPAPEIAAARALADSGEPVDAPGAPVVSLTAAPVFEGSGSNVEAALEAPETPVQLVRRETAPAADAAPPARGFTLQFGAFGERANADKQIGLLKGKVRPVWVLEGRTSSGARLFFVRGGAFESRGDATAAARKLWQSDRIDSFVRVVDRG